MFNTAATVWQIFLPPSHSTEENTSMNKQKTKTKNPFVLFLYFFLLFLSLVMFFFWQQLSWCRQMTPSALYQDIKFLQTESYFPKALVHHLRDH